MAAIQSVTRSFGALTTRRFWSFRAIHAVAGGLLTVLGASLTVFVNEGIRKEISAHDARMAAASEQLSTVDRALFQFRMAQTNAITLGVLSANDSLKPEFRRNMVELMFVTRKLPTVMMLQQLYPTDVAAFDKERAEYEALIEKAKQAEDQGDWDAVNAFEFEREARLFQIETQIFGERDRIAVERRAAARRLDFAMVMGFTLQQLGFMVVLLAGLLHQYRREADSTATVVFDASRQRD